MISTRRNFTLSTVAVAALAGAALSMALAGCSKNDAVRYKMTVEVETPQGVKSGFAVREVNRREGLMSRSIFGIKGEAVAVDIAPGQTLFALLTGGDGDADYAPNILHRALNTAPRPGDSDAPIPPRNAVALYPEAPSTYGLYNTDPLPMLVWFRDISDPQTVERVAPDALDAAFGPGVKLKRITISKTDEDVTVGIEKRLGWLNNHWDGMLNGDQIEWMEKPELAAHLASGSFSTFRKGSIQ